MCGLGLGCLTPLLTISIFQLYHGGLFFSWKPEHPVKIADLSQVTDKFYHVMLYTSPWSIFELTTSVMHAYIVVNPTTMRSRPRRFLTVMRKGINNVRMRKVYWYEQSNLWWRPNSFWRDYVTTVAKINWTVWITPPHFYGSSCFSSLGISLCLYRNCLVSGHHDRYSMVS